MMHTMKKLNARFVEKTVAAIYRFYPRSIIKGIMLTGSHATGETCPDSDIDVLLLSNLSNRQTMETLTFKGHTYQFIIAPSNKIYELVYKDYMTAHFVFLSLFEKGIILYDEDGKLGKVRSVVLSSKPWSLKDHDILTLRASVTSALETLRKSKNPQSGLCTASEAVIMTARLICGRKSYSGKHLDKILSTYPREAGALRQALEQYLCDGNGQAFAAGLETLLRTYGGLLNNHTNGYVLSAPPSTRHLLAFLPGALPSDKSIIRNVCTIVRKTSDFMPTIFYVGQGQFMEHGIYISFHSSGNNISEVLRILEDTTKKQEFSPSEHGISYPYPSCFYEGLHCGGQLLHDELAGVMAVLSDLSIRYWEKEHESHKLLLAYRFAYHYIRDVVPQQKTKVFLTDALNRLMPEALDANGMYSAHQLLARKCQLLVYMDKKYRELREELSAIVGSSCPEMDDILKGTCNSIKNILNKSKKTIFDSHSFFIEENSTYYYSFTHSLGILLLAPHEKFGVVYNTSRLLNEGRL